MTSLPDHLVAAGAAGVAGAVNALAGGGSLVSFPTLLFLGVPSVAANVTNTVALCPGYIGGTLAQRHDLAGQRRAGIRLAVASAVGGLAGAILLVLSPEKLFDKLVPFLVLAACALLAGQDRLRARLFGSGERAAHAPVPGGGVLAVAAVAVYGGYFGAGLGIMLLAVLGLLMDERLERLNALKQLLSAVINWVAAAFFLTSGEVVWSLAAVMAAGSLAGGQLGGRLVGTIRPRVLRRVVITFGVAVATAQIARW